MSNNNSNTQRSLVVGLMSRVQTVSATRTNASPGHVQVRESVTIVVGGVARRNATAQGQVALLQFDRIIQVLLVEASKTICPRGFKYYLVREGYLCGGGNHLVTHNEVDAMVAGQRSGGLRIELVNGVAGAKAIAPPAVAWHEPMHMSPEKRNARGWSAIPLKADGTFWPGVRRTQWSNY